MQIKMIKKLTLILCLIFTSIYAHSNDVIDVCFTPGMNCEAKIVSEIRRAKTSIYVQAYSFTDKVIADALISAKNRHVDINIILDKTQKNGFVAKELLDNNINTAIDYKVAIAHNKVMIIDGKEVITGSYNFTESAQHRNAENLLIIRDKIIANEYLSNWLSRFKVSKQLVVEFNKYE